MLNSNEIGQRIKNRLKELNIRQKELNEITDISNAAISNYANGTRIPATEELIKISKALNTSIEWLLTGIEFTNVKLTEDEGELLMLFNKLPKREQIKVLGVIEEKVKEFKMKTDLDISEKTS